MPSPDHGLLSLYRLCTIGALMDDLGSAAGSGGGQAHVLSARTRAMDVCVSKVMCCVQPRHRQVSLLIWPCTSPCALSALPRPTTNCTSPNPPG